LHAPAGGDVLEDVVGAIILAKAQVANLGGAAAGAAVDAAVDDQPAADPGTNRHVKHWRMSLRRAERRLGQPRDVGIVAERDRQRERVAEPTGNGEAIPAADLVRLDDALGVIVDRPTKADADAAYLLALQVCLREQFRHRGDDLPADAVAS